MTSQFHLFIAVASSLEGRPETAEMLHAMRRGSRDVSTPVRTLDTPFAAQGLAARQIHIKDEGV